MGAQGDKKVTKQSDGFQQLCGFATVKEIVAINPTKEQKAKIYGYELDDDAEDIEYVGKNDDGQAKLDLDIYFNVEGEFPTRKQRFFLENTPIVYEDEETGKKAYRYVNQVGQQTTLDEDKDEDELPDWFKYFQEWDDDAKKYVNTEAEKSFRKCLKGEDGLMKFLREALELDYEKSTANLDYNYKKLFTGNVKELLSDLTGDLFRPFVVMFQVTTSQDGENSYEKLYLPNNNFGVPTLPAEMMPHIQNGLKFPKGWKSKRWKKYNKQGELSGGFMYNYTNYPPSGFAPLEPVRVYDSAEDVAAGSSAKKTEKPTAVTAGGSKGDDDDDY